MEPLKSFSEFTNFLTNHPFPKYIGMLSEAERKTYYDNISYALKSYRVEWGVPLYKLTGYVQKNYLSLLDYEYPLAVAHELRRILFNTSYLIEYIEKLLDEGYDVDTQEFYSLIHCLIIPKNEPEIKEKYEEIFERVYEKTEQKDGYLLEYIGLNFKYYDLMLEKKTPFDDIRYGLLRSFVLELRPEETIEFYKRALAAGYTVSDLLDSIEVNVCEEMIPIVEILAQKEFRTVISYFECQNIEAENEVVKEQIEKQRVEAMYFIVNQLIEHNDCYNPLFEFLFFMTTKKVSGDLACLGFALNNEYLDTIRVRFLGSLLSKNKINRDVYEELFSRAVKRDESEFKDYTGDLIDEDIRNFMIEDDYPIDLHFVEKVNKIFEDKITERKCYETIYTVIFKKIISINREYATYYNGADLNIYKELIKDGFQINKKQIITILLFCDDLTTEEAEQYFNQLNVKPFNQRAFREYSKDRFKLVDSFNVIDDFLEQLDINRDIFIQYSFASSFDWLDSILTITSASKVGEFKNVKNYFFENYYNVKDNKLGIVTIKYLLEVLKLYTNYPDLCINIINSELTEEDKNRVKQLLNHSDVIKDRNIRNKEELFNIDRIIFDGNKEMMLESLESDDISKVKNTLCLILFGISTDTVIDYLNRYGNTKNFIQLEFNNRNNKEMVDKISEMLAYVSMMEDVCDCEDINVLKNIIRRTFKDNNTYLMCNQCNLVFQGFEEKVNRLYAEELSSNITDLKNVPNSLINEELTNKYGVKVIDLSHSNYCLIEHQVGEREKVESVINGISTGEQNIISCVVGSNRNQRIYGKAGGIVLASDFYPPGLFIKSSTTNLFSNNHYKKYSIEFNSPFLTQIQRGAIESSGKSNSNNPELLSFREGLKFEYLVLFGDNEPTEEEIRIAKANNLTFVKVQKENNSIDNPKEINNPELSEDNFLKSSDNLLYKFMGEQLKKSEEKQPRKIAILTDVHGLFEPTLSVLEDIRKQGITEVYSLGDNIGSGPNPKEVMDLLEAYNVKSLAGNHEKYVTNGVDSLKYHFDSREEYEEAYRNSEWTKSKLTPEQIERLKTLPEEVTINIGNQKILLSHYYGNYQTEEAKKVPDDVSMVFQGHIHQTRKDDKIYTVKAAGFLNHDNIANYIIITENSNNGYEIEQRNVEFDKESSFYDIIESSMNKEDKEKIEEWLGGIKK